MSCSLRKGRVVTIVTEMFPSLTIPTLACSPSLLQVKSVQNSFYQMTFSKFSNEGSDGCAPRGGTK